MFGFDGDSWCPFCKQPGLNESREGRLPDPELYGRWLERQEKPTDVATPDGAHGTEIKTLPTKQGSTTMMNCSMTSNYSAIDARGPWSRDTLRTLKMIGKRPKTTTAGNKY